MARERRGRFVRPGDAALLDAGALHDPLVVRVDHARQLVVGQALLRQVAARAGDDGSVVRGHCRLPNADCRMKTRMPAPSFGIRKSAIGKSSYSSPGMLFSICS